jgi:Flp pilus assembly protein TadG
MRSLSNDRGAIAVLVGVLLGGAALVGIGALVVDAGRLYQERAELQNGADAGALAVARSCAAGTCDTSKADTYADLNAKDGLSTVDTVCGSGGTLTSCAATTGDITDCPAAPTTGKYVDVHTSTLTDTGTLLPPDFSRSLLGNESFEGTGSKACARAAWGPPASATTVAMTISYCEWQQATAGGTSFAPPPPAVPPVSADQVLKLHDPSKPTTCPGGPAGSDGPGMFGWVDDADGDCKAFVSGGTYSADTGVSAGKSCQAALAEAQANRTVIYVPVYTSVTGTGTGGTYALKGFAAFVVTGYYLPSFKASDWLNPKNDCKGADKCVNGYFTQGLLPSAGTIGGPDLGVDIVQLTG